MNGFDWSDWNEISPRVRKSNIMINSKAFLATETIEKKRRTIDLCLSSVWTNLLVISETFLDRCGHKT